jgi:signal transduction histidine kinase
MSYVDSQPQVKAAIQSLRPQAGGQLDTSTAAPEFREALSRVSKSAVVPLVEGGKATGILVISRSAAEPFTEQELVALSGISSLAVLALRNARLHAESTALSERLKWAIESAEDLASPTEPSQVFGRLLDRARQSAQADTAALGELDGDMLVVLATTGKVELGSRWPIDPRARQALKSGEPTRLSANDYVSRESGGQLSSVLSELLLLPLLVAGRPIGMLTVARKEARPFTEKESENLRQFTPLAALLIRNAQLLQRARDSERLRADFARVAVHELRAPLTVISGYASMAEEGSFGQLTDPLRAAMTTIADKSSDMQRAIEQLMMLAQVEEGTLGAEDEPFDLRSLAAEAAKRARAHIGLSGGSVEVKATGSPVIAMGDPRLTQQVLDNLLNNAINYGGLKPSVTIEVGVEASRAYLAVEDQGDGVPEAERELIFEPFQRGSKAPLRARGSGLGLYLSKALARRMEGELVLEATAPGRGARFILFLRAAR